MEQERTTRKKQQLIEAMKQSRYIVTRACQLAGISCKTYYRWTKHPEFNQQLNDTLFKKNNANDF